MFSLAGAGNCGAMDIIAGGVSHAADSWTLHKIGIGSRCYHSLVRVGPLAKPVAITSGGIAPGRFLNIVWCRKMIFSLLPKSDAVAEQKSWGIDIKLCQMSVQRIESASFVCCVSNISSEDWKCIFSAWLVYWMVVCVTSYILVTHGQTPLLV